jgi:hypothetical protein
MAPAFLSLADGFALENADEVKEFPMRPQEIGAPCEITSL